MQRAAIARLLSVDEPLASRPAFSLAIERHGQAQGNTREVEILPNMAVVGRTVADLGVPPEVLILLIGRGEGFVVPRGQTRIEPYDTLLMLGDEEKLKEANAALLSPPVSPKPVPTPTDPLAALPTSTDAKYLSKQIVLVGYGRVGRRIAEHLAQHGVPYVVTDQNREIIEKLRESGVAAVVGDASNDIVLAQAHIAKAAMLIVATPDTMKVRQMVDTARKINPNIAVVIRSHSEMEAKLLEQEETGKIFLGEMELANSIATYVLEHLKKGGKTEVSNV